MDWDAIESSLRTRWLAGLRGDGAAYEEALRQASARLRVYFSRRLGDPAAATEDLIQETLLALHQQRHSYDANLPFTVWMHAIARYKWYDHLRLQGRQRGLFESWSDELAEQAQGEADVRTAARDVDRLLTQLPPAQRRAIEHARLRGDSVAEAAETLGVSESALKVQVHRGLKRLMALIGKN